MPLVSEGDGSPGSGLGWRLHQIQCPVCGGREVTPLPRAFVIVIDDPAKPQRPPLPVTPIECNRSECGHVYFLPEPPDA